jgi:C4-type Zn-finger protein
MATPARFTELSCYVCKSSHWQLVSDYPSDDGTFVAVDSLTYTCPNCSHVGTDFMVLQQSPPQAILNMHSAFGRLRYRRWARIARKHFPDLLK